MQLINLYALLIVKQQKDTWIFWEHQKELIRDLLLLILQETKRSFGMRPHSKTPFKDELL
jgi:hypothetical protein